LTTGPGLDRATVNRLLLSNALLCRADDDQTASSTQSFTLGLLPVFDRTCHVVSAVLGVVNSP
jgi:hypothetical protein